MTEQTNDDLTEEERAMLELEQGWWKHPGAKDGTIRERFDLSPTQYYARLHRLISQPAALAAYPLVVHRLQRLEQRRRAQRTARGRRQA